MKEAREPLDIARRISLLRDVPTASIDKALRLSQHPSYQFEDRGEKRRTLIAVRELRRSRIATECANVHHQSVWISALIQEGLRIADHDLTPILGELTPHPRP